MINILGKLPFLRKIDRKKEKGLVSFTHQQNIFAAEHFSQTLGQTQLDDIAHEQQRNTGDGVRRRGCASSVVLVDLENMAESCLRFRRKK